MKKALACKIGGKLSSQTDLNSSSEEVQNTVFNCNNNSSTLSISLIQYSIVLSAYACMQLQGF